MMNANADRVPVKRVLMSVSDKTGLVELARTLGKHNAEIVSTGGTAALLAREGIPHTPIEALTGNPEAFGGRMKTISFQVGSALLFRRGNPGDEREAEALGIKPIDMVVCNLYPFEAVVRATGELSEWIENIDIGGPAMIRAAAKNFSSVACVVSPEDYGGLIRELEERAGSLSFETRRNLALKAFQRIASYDLNIAYALTLRMGAESRPVLRYGENPHQKAVLLPFGNAPGVDAPGASLARAEFIQGKELSYNNLLDSDQAYKCVSELAGLPSAGGALPAATVIVKHGNPCGMALHEDAFRSLEAAWNADPTSAFGGILAFSRPLTAAQAGFLKERFVEVLIAPGYEAEALEILRAKKNVRVLKVALKECQSGPASGMGTSEITARSIHGGLLLQTEDEGVSSRLESVTRKPLPGSLRSLSNFGLVATKYLKSNCIGLYTVKDGALVTLASGSGQPNRLDCISKLIAPKLKDLDWNPDETLLVSDAFFPFRDSIDVAASIGVKHILQPGGSIRDAEVIAACDEAGIAMAFTGMRHFRH